MKFTHLILSTEYSVVYSTLALETLFKAHAHLLKDMQAMAVTDANNIFCGIKFSGLAQAKRIKAIYGSRILVYGVNQKPYPLHLFAKTPLGYGRMMHLLGWGFAQAPQHKDGLPIYTLEDLKALKDVFCFSGGMYGELGQTMLYAPDQIDAVLQRYLSIFGDDFILDIHRIYREPREEIYIERCLIYAARYQLVVVATGHVCFLHKHDFEAHLVKSCIHTKKTLYAQVKQPWSPHQYFHTSAEMIALFHDLPEAIQNTQYIVENCNVLIPADKLPMFPRFHQLSNSKLNAMLLVQARLGFMHRYHGLKQQQLIAYQKRFQHEIRTIALKGYADYFLIVADIVAWARRQAIPVGPGRGSGAGCFLAFCLQITDIDPLVHGLLFERFLNIERSSLPDFDIDFCVHQREKVIHYVKNKYGIEFVAQIIAYSTLTARAVIKDVARILGLNFQEANRLTRLMSAKPDAALETEMAMPALKNLITHDYKLQKIFTYGLALEKLVRGATRHAAGVIIAHCSIVGMGTHCGHRDESHLAFQWDKDDLEVLGLFKFDFLGLRTMTIINAIVQKVEQVKHQKIAFHYNDALTDEKTFDLLRSGKTDGVFQLESKGMQQLLVKSQLTKFEDIVMIISLYRPGPLNSGMVASYLDIRAHKKPPLELHPCLRETLQETYGLIVYQEQIMQAGKHLSNFSLGQGDILQRAITRKNLVAVEAFRKLFLQGALRKNIPPAKIEEIFNIIVEFANYGFNKSHASSYALITYRTAYLKAHQPALFYCVSLSEDIASVKIMKTIFSAKADGINILTPCINLSQDTFTYIDDQNILYGLAAVKGLGKMHCDAIVQARGPIPFKDFDDFLLRMFQDKKGKALCETLIYSGALDCFAEGRSWMLRSLDSKFQHTKFQHACQVAQAKGKVFKGKKPAMLNNTPWIDYEPIYILDLLKEEQKRLGLVLSVEISTLENFWLTRLQALPFREHKPVYRQAYYTYVGMILEVVTLFNNNILYKIQGRTEMVDCRINKHAVLMSIGDIIVIKSRNPAKVNQYTQNLSIYADIITPLDQSINQLIIKQALACPYPHFRQFSAGFTKCVTRFVQASPKTMSTMIIELRVNVSPHHQVIMKITGNVNAYYLQKQLSNICAFSYILTRQ